MRGRSALAWGPREALRRDPGNTELQKALEDALAQARAQGIVLSEH